MSLSSAVFDHHPALASKACVAELPLSDVLIEEDVAYPWALVVPRRRGVRTLLDLPQSERLQLMDELSLVQMVLVEQFQPDHVNVAAIGNRTPALHVHVIGRWETDPAWPATVWEKSRVKYSSALEFQHVLERWKKGFEKGL